MKKSQLRKIIQNEIKLLKENTFDHLEVGDDSVTYNPKLKREIDLMMQSGEALLNYQWEVWGGAKPSIQKTSIPLAGSAADRRIGEYEAWEPLRNELIELHNQSAIANPEGFADFIDRNKDNTLPNSSSGSFFNALIDIDGLLSAWDDMHDFSEEEYDIASDYWEEQRSKLIQRHR